MKLERRGFFGIVLGGVAGLYTKYMKQAKANSGHEFVLPGKFTRKEFDNLGSIAVLPRRISEPEMRHRLEQQLGKKIRWPRPVNTAGNCYEIVAFGNFPEAEAFLVHSSRVDRFSPIPPHVDEIEENQIVQQGVLEAVGAMPKLPPAAVHAEQRVLSTHIITMPPIREGSHFIYNLKYAYVIERVFTTRFWVKAAGGTSVHGR
jgi:hypothetical protein